MQGKIRLALLGKQQFKQKGVSKALPRTIDNF
jgi:hypothetical protein